MTKYFLLLLSVLFLNACATHLSRLAPAKAALRAGQCDSAIKILDELSAQEGGDQLLYLMEYASALQICRDYKKSNQIFLQADKLSEQIDYTSASRVVGATLLNEEMIQYKGDSFEKLFINTSAAMNYLELQEPDEAMVEVRRINEKYSKFSAEEKNSFELNSFAQYLSGLIYEQQKKFDDACIAYGAAYKLDPSFRYVALDMLSACWRAKRTQEFEKLSLKVAPSSEELVYIKRKNKNEKIIIYLQGLGPQKAPRPENHLYPYLVSTPNLIKKILVSYTDDKETASAETSRLVYNVEKAAVATQEADYNSLSARRLAARVAKEVAADQIRQKDKALGNIALLLMLVSERADLRNWSLLPETIQIVRLSPLKNSKIKIKGLDQLQSEVEDLDEIDLMKNENKNIYMVRSLR